MDDEPGPSLRIHGVIAHDIGIEIVSGARRPGEVFGGEIEASEALGVSRTAYREAIRILAAKGLVESKPKAGTRVTPRPRWNLLDPDILAWMFEGEPEPGFILDLFELRTVIEPAAAAFAACRRSDADLAMMESALEAMGRLGLAGVEGQAADQRFHRIILTAAGNEPLASLASTVGAAVRWTTLFKQRTRALPRDPLPDHVAVYQAIAEQDEAAARAAMGELLRLALADMELPDRR
ncbi:MAG: GntR family transcriptional regulator [Sphingomonas sp. 28-66-16]|nr:MAG: GntR family transcriptional regulator [Sphingomonas sp. 28-66-16]